MNGHATTRVFTHMSNRNVFDLHSRSVKHLSEAFGFIKARLMNGFRVKNFFTCSCFWEANFFRKHSRNYNLLPTRKKIGNLKKQGKLKVDKNVRNVLNTLAIYNETDWSLARNSKTELFPLGLFTPGSRNFSQHKFNYNLLP